MVTQEIAKITGQARDNLGTRQTKRLRTDGRLPAVIYGHKQQPVHVSFDLKEVNNLLHQNTHLIEVVVGSKTEPCLIKDIQWNHLGSNILHIDLARVDLKERVTVSVELELTGDPVGLKESGAFLQHPVNEIEVLCLAAQIPDQIKADISNLAVGQSLSIADLQLPNGVETNADPETVIASIQVVGEEPETEITEEASATEPELLRKKETEEKTPE